MAAAMAAAAMTQAGFSAAQTDAIRGVLAAALDAAGHEAASRYAYIAATGHGDVGDADGPAAV